MKRWKIELKSDAWKTFPTGTDPHDLADWHELMALAPSIKMSPDGIMAGIGSASRDHNHSNPTRSANGSHDLGDVIFTVGSEITGVFSRRQTACGVEAPNAHLEGESEAYRYPLKTAGSMIDISSASQVLPEPLNERKRPGIWTRRRVVGPAQTESSWMDEVYLFLLLATRMNMGKDRLNDSRLDGSQLFEHLCAVSLRGFFGVRCHTKAVGAREIAKDDPDRLPRSTPFHRRLTDLSVWLNEGAEDVICQVLDEESCSKLQKAGDGGIDVVARLGFAERPVRDAIYHFAQCKTGTSYTRQDASDLIPERFVVKFFAKWQIMLPSFIGRIFMIADHPSETACDELKLCGCTVFDRCRVLEALTRSIIETTQGLFGSGTLLAELREWNQCVLKMIEGRKPVKKA
jgi:hypothetical protein